MDDLHPGHLAYMIYTSGSTGKPKGAGNTHEGLHNRLAWMQDAYRLGGDDVVLQKTPFGFDVSVWEFFWPLMVGARLVVAAPGAHRDPARLVETIRRAWRDDAALRAVDAAGLHGACGLGAASWSSEHDAALRELAADHLQRRGAAGGASGSGRQAFAAGSAGEPVRSDRSLDRRDALGLRRRSLAGGADRPSDLEHAGLCFGRWS